MRNSSCESRRDELTLFLCGGIVAPGVAPPGAGIVVPTFRAFEGIFVTVIRAVLLA